MAKVKSITNVKSVAQPHRNGLASVPNVRHGIRSLNQFRCPSLLEVLQVGMQEPFLSVQNCLLFSQSGFLDLARGTPSLTESLGRFVPGSVILLGGAPGAGKSTLLLQVTTLPSAQKPCLYVTGKNREQIALRAQRLGLNREHLECVSETRVEAIAAIFDQVKPALVVVDSVQVMQVESLSGAPGSVGQVRESAAQLTRLAKATGVIVLWWSRHQRRRIGWSESTRAHY